MYFEGKKNLFWLKKSSKSYRYREAFDYNIIFKLNTVITICDFNILLLLLFNCGYAFNIYIVQAMVRIEYAERCTEFHRGRNNNVETNYYTRIKKGLVNK